MTQPLDLGLEPELVWVHLPVAFPCREGMCERGSSGGRQLMRVLSLVFSVIPSTHKWTSSLDTMLIIVVIIIICAIIY